MSKNVFANGKGISAKKDDNKSICAMPDVCNSPPSPPAGPIPIPYPNTATAADTSDGSKSVKIGGGEVGTKNSSNYKKSNGDEAATKGLGMNLTTATIQGKMKHAAWSMDVKIEGANAIRHMDMTTHNHMNCPGTGSMTINQELEQIAQFDEITCEQLEEAMQEMQEVEVDPDYQNRNALANAHYVPNVGPGSYMRAASTQTMILDDYRDAYEDSLKPKAQRPGCAPPGTPRAGNRIQDSESKILTPLSESAQGGSILMNITHSSTMCPPGDLPGVAPADRMPCLHCRRAICTAEACGIEVYICTDGDPVRPADAGLCPPAETGGDAALADGGASVAWDPAWEAAGLGCR